MEKQKITLDLTFLRQYQKEFFKNYKRFNVLVCHRRFWKTVLAVLFLLYRALENKGLYWYIAPTYKQSKAIAFDMLKKFAEKIPWTNINISELTIELFNWSKIRLFWSDYPDSLRWLDLKWVVFDEYAQQPSSIYWEIVFPMINANNGWILWIWTPKWKNNFYDLYIKAIEDDKYYTMLYTVNDTNLLNEEQLKQAREEMNEDEYNQEYLCSWTASIKGAYYSKEMQEAREQYRILSHLPQETQLKVNTFWDLWINDTMVIIFAQFYWKEVRIIDHYENSWEWFEHYIKILKTKSYDYWDHYFPHDIEVKELQSWISRKEFLIKSWIENIRVVPKVSIQDWIDAVRRTLKYCYFDESKCFRLIEALTQYHKEYDDKNKIYRSSPKHDWSSNSADATRYLALSYEDITEVKQKTKVYVPNYAGI